MMTDEEIIRECQNEIRRLRGVIRELQESKKYLLIRTDGQEIETTLFDFLDDALGDVEKQYRKCFSKDLPRDMDPSVDIEKGGNVVFHIHGEDTTMWKVVEIPMI